MGKDFKQCCIYSIIDSIISGSLRPATGTDLLLELPLLKSASCSANIRLGSHPVAPVTNAHYYLQGFQGLTKAGWSSTLKHREITVLKNSARCNSIAKLYLPYIHTFYTNFLPSRPSTI